MCVFVCLCVYIYKLIIIQCIHTRTCKGWAGFVSDLDPSDRRPFVPADGFASGARNGRTLVLFRVRV